MLPATADFLLSQSSCLTQPDGFTSGIKSFEKPTSNTSHSLQCNLTLESERSKVVFDNIGKAAFQRVLVEAGATMPKRDLVDWRIVEIVRTGIIPRIEISPKSAAKAVEVGFAPNWVQELIDSVPKGYITDPSEGGGYPNYQRTRLVDSDSDGMPDEWETQRNLDSKNPLDANQDRNGDGYTNIEEYING